MHPTCEFCGQRRVLPLWACEKPGDVLGIPWLPSDRWVHEECGELFARFVGWRMRLADAGLRGFLALAPVWDQAQIAVVAALRRRGEDRLRQVRSAAGGESGV